MAFGTPLVMDLLVGATGNYAVPLVVLATRRIAGAGLFH